MKQIDALKAVDAHAYSRYEKGWDLWIETLDTDVKGEIIEGATTKEEAIEKAAIWLQPQLEVNAHQADSQALYDTGCTEDEEYYAQINANAQQSVAVLIK